MTRPVRWTTRASSQLEDAAVYLDQERPGTGVSFIDQVEAILQVASDHPEAFHIN
jgi:plasmid stabilization system protein ParE